MKILVAGGRDFDDYDRLKSDLDALKPSTIISGMAKGTDLESFKYAQNHNIPAMSFPANWNHHGKSAGYKRNQQMINEGKPNLVLIYWNGSSKGTAHCISVAKAKGIRVIVKYYGENQHNLEKADEIEQSQY